MLNIRLGHGYLRNGPFWFPKLLFLEPICNQNAWDYMLPEQGIACWVFCVVFIKKKLDFLN